MAGASGNTEELHERVKEAKKILKLRDVNDKERMESFKKCAKNATSSDTRCLVVLEGLNGKQGKQYFWERQRAKEKIKNNKVKEESTLEKENEECEYHKGRHAETYVLARLDLYLKEEEEEERSFDDLNKRTKNIEISKKGKSKQTQNAGVQQKDAVQQKKIVTIYTNYSPCDTINRIYPNSESCMKRIIEFLTTHDDIIMNINYANEYQSGNSDEVSDIDKDLKKQEEELIQSNRLNIRSPLELMIDNMGRIIRER